MTSRTATHAGSWYSSNPTTLSHQLDQLLSAASQSQVAGARAILGPHAGYAYCGHVLAEAYSALDISRIKRVFIMGPSHHIWFRGHVETTAFDAYKTPIGTLPVDTEVIADLIKADPQMFHTMTAEADEEEHCFEMHMPFLFKVAGSVPIVPIMISDSNEQFERRLGKDLKKYFDSPENAFIITSDFCHWGYRFRYTAYSPDGQIETLDDEPSASTAEFPIWKSIQAMDKKAMEVASSGKYKDFRSYLKRTGNTICGAKPLSVLLSLMEGGSDHFHWNGYDQSSHVISPMDSSVSYASGYATI